MKNGLIITSLGMFLMSSGLSAAGEQPLIVDVSKGQFYSQIMIKSAQPLTCHTQVLVPGEKLQVLFPRMKMGLFVGLDKTIEKEFPGVKAALSCEKCRLDNREVELNGVKQKIPLTPVECVVLSLTFEKNSVLIRVTNSVEVTQNQGIVAIDIFDQKMLETLRKKGTTLYFACNEQAEKNLASVFPRQSWADDKKKRVLSPFKAHIVIDAGHGADDPGARSNGLQEKDVTLDIARRAYRILKEEGYRVFLTRNDDVPLSVIDRFQLAQQLKADVFVSVHVNSVRDRGGVSGIETHCLDGRPFFNQAGESKFFFAQSDEQQQLARAATVFLQEKVDASFALSKCIQTAMLGYLKNKRVDVADRGVKRTWFRTLLRSEVPATIVEVGFITNQAEARSLAQSGYRQHLADGICEGIKSFLAL